MFLAEIDKSQIAVLSNIGTTETVVSLGAGGPAVLSVPSAPFVDGQETELIISGLVHSNLSNNNFTLGVYVGSSATVGSDQQVQSTQKGVSGVGDYPFFYTARVFWDSTTQKVSGVSNLFLNGSLSTNVVFSNATVSSQTGLQFVISGTFDHNDSNNSLTITEFKLNLV